MITHGSLFGGCRSRIAGARRSRGAPAIDRRPAALALLVLHGRSLDDADLGAGAAARAGGAVGEAAAAISGGAGIGGGIPVKQLLGQLNGALGDLQRITGSRGEDARGMLRCA